MLTVRELLETPHLGLSVVAGNAGVGRPVSWVHISEIEDAADWLDGNELILATGVGFPETPNRQTHYLRRLVNANAAGLGIGHRSPGLTQEMIKAADDLGFPVMTVQIDVPFLVISRFVAAANHGTAMTRLTTQVRIFDSLRARVEEDLSTAEFFSRLESISGYSLHVVTAGGRSLLPGLPDAPQEIRPQIPGIADRSPAIDNGYGVPVPLAGRTAAYVLALGGSDLSLGLIATRHIATIAALEIATLYRERESNRRAGAELLSELMSGRLGAEEAQARLAESGFARGSSYVLLAVRAGDGMAPAGDELNHSLEDARVPNLLLGASETLFVLTSSQPVELDEVLTGLGMYAGVSDTFSDFDDMAVPRVQALWALDRAVSRDTDKVVRFDASEGWMTWILNDVAALRSIAEGTLGALMEYDSANRTELMKTLRVYLELDRRPGPAAEILCIHKHTLQYRLRRIAEITGRSTSKVEDLTEFWLALRAQALAEHTT